MSGDWIKMRVNLWDDPRVASICDRAAISEAAAIGALYWLWTTADQHSTDGAMAGLTPKSIDRKTGIAGFADAVRAVGWLEDTADGVQIVRFDEHNGKSAKRRCSESVRKMSARDADKMQRGGAPREEREGDGEGLTDQQQASSQKGGGAPPASRSRSTGSRLPAEWKLPKAWGDWALLENAALTADDVRKEGEKFADHWHAKAGKDGRKADWPATWRSWIRSEYVKPSRAAKRGAWFLSAPGIEAKARELDISQGDGENFQYFKLRVFKAAGVTEEMIRNAQADRGRA